jgi:3-deoxy-D-manno-octulosonate 8-phosphate phosphatase (KDO 8-P phosphatase)
MIITPEFIEKAAQIKLIIFDVDGVFTNGLIYVDDNGLESKAFNVLDGQGIKFLQEETNIQIAIISGRKAPGVDIRMKQLGIKYI